MPSDKKSSSNNFHLVERATESLRFTLRNKKATLKDRVHNCAIACKEIIDFHPFSEFEEFHQFILALGTKSEEDRKILEKASSNAWFNPKKDLSKSLIIRKKRTLQAKKAINFLSGPVMVKKSRHKKTSP